MRFVLTLIVLLTAVVAACDGAASDAAGATAGTRGPGYIVDTVFPMEEELRRFRANVDQVRSLDSSAPRSIDALIKSFAAAVSSRDTVALRAMHISLAEYAWIYFPPSRFAQPPYELKPALAWFWLTSDSNAGLTKVMRLFDAAPLSHSGRDCDPATQVGSYRLWEKCQLHWRDSSGELRWGRLFGSIIELDGRFKFASYANAL